MSVEKTESIILKTQPFQETTKIVRLYTRSFGKLSVIAKGARKPKSPFQAVLETGYHVEIVFYYKTGRELHTLGQCDLIDRFAGIAGDFDRTAAMTAIFELFGSGAVGEEPDAPLFDRIVGTLKILALAPKNHLLYYWSFVLFLLANQGFRLNVERCIGCGGILSGGKMHISFKNGGIFCEKCSAREITDFSVSPESLKLLDKFSGLEPAEIGRFVPSPFARKEINELLHRFMLYHLEGYRRPKSLGFLEV